MSAITRCACLLAVERGRILLVRVRENRLWYLPGGKIEPGEHAVDTIFREAREELGIELEADSPRYVERIVGPNLEGMGQAELLCFAARWRGTPTPQAEVREVAWWPLNRVECFAPALRPWAEGRLSWPDVARGMRDRPRQKP